jgi:hypothetical protein
MALTPPDEQFWVRYSPHHEFPLSTVTSVALHVLVIVLLLLGAWVAFKLGWMEDNRSVPVVAVVVEGGGSPGDGLGPEKDGQSALREDVPGTPHPGKTNPTLPKLEGPPEVSNPAKVGDRPVRPPSAVDWRGPLNDLGKTLGGKLGPGGPGKDRGQDGGVGPNKGPGPGEKTRERMQRWTLIFNTNDGNDYARQLSAFGALVVYPEPTDPPRYRAIGDLLARPVKAEIEDITQIKRMFWVDEKDTSVASLAQALGIKPAPPAFAMFFPPEMEPRLLKLELEYAGRTEQELRQYETKFEVYKTKDGRYEIRVISQTLKPL